MNCMLYVCFAFVVFAATACQARVRLLRHSLGPSDGAANRSFVRVNGTQLYVTDVPFYFQGSNNYYLAQSWMSRDDVDAILYHHAASGLTAIRFWPFGNAFDNLQDDFTWVQPGNRVPGHLTLSDTAFRRVDYILFKANQLGMKVLMPFINFEDSIFSIRWFTQAIKGHDNRKEHFFVDAAIINAFKQFVISIVFHKNHINGVQYIHDGTILAWELMNEPHTSDAFEATRHGSPFGNTAVWLYGDRKSLGSIVQAWICGMAAFLHTIDPNHLVTSGEEGYRSTGKLTGKSDWLENGLKGVDFEKDALCEHLDFLTVHVYPDNWNIAYEQHAERMLGFLASRQQIAHKHSKPIIMEEYGCCKAADYKGKRANILKFLHRSIDDLGYAGSLVWSLAPDASLAIGPDYSFSIKDDPEAFMEIAAHAALQKQKCVHK